MKIAFIIENVIQTIYTETILPDYLADPRYILLEGENENAQIGWFLDGENFIEPAIVEPQLPIPELPKYITLLAYMLRLTKEERTAIRAAEITNDDVADMLYLLRMAKFIDLDNPIVIGGLVFLESLGLLEPGRKEIILGSPVQEHEKAVY